MKLPFGRTWLGESRKQELERRIQALEAHIQDNARRMNVHDGQITWLLSWHQTFPKGGHEQYVSPPEEG